MTRIQPAQDVSAPIYEWVGTDETSGERPITPRPTVAEPTIDECITHIEKTGEPGTCIRCAATISALLRLKALEEAARALQIQALQSPDLLRTDWGQEALALVRSALKGTPNG